MDLRDNSPALTPAQRIKDQIGLDVLDDAAVGRVLEVCRDRGARARRLAVISGVLAAAIVIAWIVAGVLGQVHGFELILLPVLLVINAVRMVSAVMTARKMARIPRDIEAARAHTAPGSPARGHAAASGPGVIPPGGDPAGGSGGAIPPGWPRPGRPSPDVARWN